MTLNRARFVNSSIKEIANLEPRDVKAEPFVFR